MGAATSSAGGKDDAAGSFEVDMSGADFSALERKCAELMVEFEPTIAEQLAHIERRKDVSRSRKKQLRETAVMKAGCTGLGTGTPSSRTQRQRRSRARWACVA